MERLLLSSMILPMVLGILVFALRRARPAADLCAVIATAANLAVSILLFKGNAVFSRAWIGLGFEFSLRLYNLSAFIILAMAAFGFLLTLYSVVFMRGKSGACLFHALVLISLALANGAVLANNLILMLFFWEALGITLWGMIAVGGRHSFRTATKAFIILGICDLCLMAGIAVCGHLAGTLTISKITITTGGLGGLAFIFMAIGAISKAGSMPFHTWIPDAATDAPLPFMAIFPGALEKLLGIYLLTRISLDMFTLSPDSWASFAMMSVGAITLVGAVLMALVQKDYKRLLSYHAISQVGYMILGIGTLLPVGIIGGLFHMINNALYKSCLFLTGGSVEKQTGTTDLEKLGGLGRMMPVTFICFIITAASISGVPPFNGFFSKELIYDGALERGKIFYFAAIFGSFLTAASFLKLGHAAFLGKPQKEDVKEAPVAMLVPMIIIAGLCILFGLWNSLPITEIFRPILGPGLEGHNFAGWPANKNLVLVTILVLIAAVANHLWGFKRTGSGLKAVDHIHYAPGLRTVYEKTEKGKLDPYNLGMKLADVFAGAAASCDKAIDWIYNNFTPSAAGVITGSIVKLHDGNYRTYMLWSIAATAIIISFLLK